MNIIEVIGIFSNIFLASINSLIWNAISMIAPSSQLFSTSTIANVRQSWLLIGSDTEAVGCGILFKIFEKNPEYLEKFNTLKTTSVNELKESQEFLMHCDRVGRALEMVIENLDKPGVLIPALKNLGKRHIKYKVSHEYLLNSEPMILQFVTESLKKHTTLPDQTVLEAWKDVLHAGVATMIRGQEDEGEIQRGNRR